MSLPKNKLVMRNYNLIPIENLVPYLNNSRTHSEDQITQIANSISEFGFTNPCLIDEHQQLIAGHGRLEAAKRLGIDKIPCITIDGLSQEQIKALIIADNKLALNADWDYGLLKAELETLKENDFDLSLIGFSDAELDDLFSVEEFEGFSDCDSVPDVPEEPKSKLGDIWTLGQHRLVCGDSTNALDVEKLLNGQIPNTMITDPPYGINHDSSWRSSARGSGKKSDREKEGALKNDDRADWYDAYILFPGNVVYVWHSDKFSDIIMENIRRAGFDLKQKIVWVKNNHTLSMGDYQSKHEPCWYAIKKGKDRNWKGGRTQMTVWEVNSIRHTKDDQTSHPTQKPVDLYIKSLENHTNPGEYVYDPFGGSGTLIIACEKIKRRALVMELDPKFVDVILQRFLKYTNIDPIRDDGKSFKELMEVKNGETR